MAPATWLAAMDATSGGWCSLGEGGSLQAVPFHHGAALQSRLNSSLFQLAGGDFQPLTQRHRAAHVAVSFKSEKEGAAAIEEKEGKDTDGKALPEPDSVLAEDMDPKLHGKTSNKESCRCLPNSIEPPKAAWLMRRAAEGLGPKSRAAHRNIYHERLDQVDSGTKEELQVLYKAEKFRDYAFEDLHNQHKKTEKAAKRFKEAFQAVKDAYSEGDCLRVHEKAEENGEEVPECHEKFEKAAKDVKEIRALISPTCKVGAISLSAMQPPRAKSIVAEESIPLPPELLVAIPTPTQSTPGRCLSSQKQRRAFRTSEFHRFL